jgi:hypothetical protein
MSEEATTPFERFRAGIRKQIAEIDGPDSVKTFAAGHLVAGAGMMICSLDGHLETALYLAVLAAAIQLEGWKALDADMTMMRVDSAEEALALIEAMQDPARGRAN